jgi:hypothetical protein
VYPFYTFDKFTASGIVRTIEGYSRTVVKETDGMADWTELKVMRVPESGKAVFGLGRSASYDAAARGEWPIIRVGGREWVSIPAFLRRLEAVGQSRAA